MTKSTMQKWQRDHFVSELNRNYDPLINAAEFEIKINRSRSNRDSRKKPGR